MNQNEPIKGRCNAKTKRGFCRKHPMKDRARCMKHGGKTPRGLASPHFKTGEHSGYLPHLPPDWARFYSADDPELVSLKRELALNLSAIRSVIANVNEEVAHAKKKTPNLLALWTQLEPMLKLHEKLVATESRRLKEQEELIERKEFARFVKAVLLVIASYVTDRQVKGKIQTDVMRLLGVTAPPVITGERVIHEAD